MKKIALLVTLFCITLYANAQQNPLIIWSFETKGKILSHPIIDKDNIYFGSNDSVFYAINIKTGQKSWGFKTNSTIQSKAIIDKDNLYFKSGNDVFALDKGTGAEIWHITSNDKKGATQIDLWDYHSGAPAIFKSIIYFGFGNGKVKGFDLKTGEIKMEISIPDSSAIKSGLVVENAILYFGDWDGRIYAYNLNTGLQLWKHKTYSEKLYDTFGQINTQLCVSGDLIYFGGRNPELQLINKNTGEKEWAYIEKDGGWISGDPLVLNDTLFIGGSDNHEMLAFNANTGEKYWSYLFLNNNFSKPLAYQDYLLFTTGDAYTVYGTSPGRGYVYALNRSDGTIKNFTMVGGNIYTNPVVSNNILLVGSTDGNLYALDLNTFLKQQPKLKIKGYDSFDILDVSPFPFSDTVQISCEFNYTTIANIKITDLNENEIMHLYSGKIKSGLHSIIWDGKNNIMDVVEDGYYFIEISSGEYFKKAIINKQVTDE